MLRKIAVYIALAIALSCAAYFAPIDYSYDDFKEYTNVLLNASGMVFTLMGIWIAFLYPNALSRIVAPETIRTVDFSESLEETKRLEAIVSSVLKSAIIVLSIMLIYLAKILLYKQNVYYENVALFKSIAVSLVTILSLLQIEAIWHVMFSNIMFINDLHHRREDREADADV